MLWKNAVYPSEHPLGMDDVYVVELATTGPSGYPKDTVAEIAVCRVMSDGSDFETVYNDGIALDPKDLGKDPLDYMEENYGIVPEDLYVGSDVSRVASDVQGLIFGKECTAYNVGNVFGKYLSFEPWDCARNLTVLPSISVRLPPELKGPPEMEHTLIRSAYDAICPGDPAMVGDGRRAIHLAQMAASVFATLRRNGLARSGSETENHRTQDEIRQCRQVEQRIDDEQRDGEERRYEGDDERQNGGR